MKISIISTFYNDKKMLKNIMDSVLCQTYNNIEHIIKDAGSTDGSIELIKSYEEKYMNAGIELKWISEKDSGLYNGFNRAFEMATGDYLIIGTDPYYSRDVIKKIADKVLSNNLDYVFGGMLFQSNGKIIRQWSGKKGNWRFGWIAATPTLCFKSQLWKKYGPFDESYKSASDYKFQVKLFMDKALKYNAIEEPLVLYYAGGTSNGGIKGKMLSIKECASILKDCKVRMGWFTNFCKTVIALFAYMFASHKKIDLEETK